MRSAIRKIFTMTNQNSGIERQIRPDEAMELLGIKKDAYHDRRKFLGIEHQRDSEGKVWLLPEDFDRMQALGEYIVEHGKMDGFLNRNVSELATINQTGLAESTSPKVEEPSIDNDLGRQIFRAAAELKASELAMMPALVREVANRMTKEDLPDDLKQEVERTEEANRPNFHPGAIAERLIDQFRQSREQLA